MKKIDWPTSNYPILLALFLLIATAITLAMGNEPLAEQLAIYAYYLLVIGVTIRFLELAVPDNTLHKTTSILLQIMEWKKRKKKINRFDRYLSFNFILTRSEKIQQTFKCISGIGTKINGRVNIEHISNISSIVCNVSIYLTVMFVLILMFGSIYGWWVVRGYLEKMVLIIIVIFLIHVLMEIFIRKYST